MLDLPRPLFLYDGECRFCRASARLIARLDKAGRFSFLPQHDERAGRFVALVPDTERFKSFHVIDPDGSTHSRGDATVVMLATLRPTSLLGKLLRTLRAGRVVTILYQVVASNRGRLGRFVRDAPGPVRWP